MLLAVMKLKINHQQTCGGRRAAAAFAFPVICTQITDSHTVSTPDLCVHNMTISLILQLKSQHSRYPVLGLFPSLAACAHIRLWLAERPR